MTENNKDKDQDKNKDEDLTQIVEDSVYQENSLIDGDDNPSKEDSLFLQSSEDNQSNETQGHIQQKQNRFQSGEILTFVKVRFPGNAKSFPFLIGKRKVIYGQKVVAMSDRGMAVGYINSFPFKVPFNENMETVRSITKVATDEDLTHQKELYQREKHFEQVCKRLIDKHNVDMNLTHVEFTQFGKKGVFYFTAPARIDFRELVKDMVLELKVRVELRQISVRDRAAAVGGIGPCGLQLCCSSFLSKYGAVSLKMAKNQDLSLASQKLNGVCGQLKCCLSYEDESYNELRNKLPEIDQYIETVNGECGVVEKIALVAQTFDMISPDGVRRRYSKGQFKGPAPENFQMPNHIDHINDETQTVIGIELDLQNKRARLEADIVAFKTSSVEYANQIFTSFVN